MMFGGFGFRNVKQVPLPPAVTTAPVSQSVCEGDAVTFTADVTGRPTPTYQWQVDDGGGWDDIVGATGSSYTIAEIASAQDGNQYRCVATNSEGSVTSSAATLTIPAPSIPVITGQPTNQSVDVGDPATFTVVVADCCPSPTYSWQAYHETYGWNAFGTNSPSYTFDSTGAPDDGWVLRCVITNSAGSVTSNEVTLTVIGEGCGGITANQTVRVETQSGMNPPVEVGTDADINDNVTYDEATCTVVMSSGPTAPRSQVTLTFVGGGLYDVEYYNDDNDNPPYTLTATNQAFTIGAYPVPSAYYWVSGTVVLAGAGFDKYLYFPTW